MHFVLKFLILDHAKKIGPKKNDAFCFVLFLGEKSFFFGRNGTALAFFQPGQGKLIVLILQMLIIIRPLIGMYIHIYFNK